MRKSDAPVHVKYLQTMVECLSMLGKVSAAGAIIWYAVKFESHRIGWIYLCLNRLALFQYSSTLWMLSSVQL